MSKPIKPKPLKKSLTKTSKIKIISDSDSSEIEFDSDTEDEKEEKQIPIRTKDLEIKRLDLHNQILLRPNMYIGSVKRLKPPPNNPVWHLVDNKITRGTPTYSDGLYRIFIEAVSNAIDNVWRSKEFGIPAKKIKIFIDKESGVTSVWNDGKPVSLDKHPIEKMYNPELIFGVLLTSTNYNDNEARKTSGQNGYGIKAVNIMSQKFELECYNPEFNQIYKQKWTNNMFDKEDPIITKHTKGFTELGKKSGYTQVTWIPDFKRFDNMKGYDDDIISLYEKYIYDIAMVVSKHNVKVEYNGKDLNINSLKDYAKMYIIDQNDSFDDFSSDESDNENDKEKPKEEIHMFSSDDSKVVIIPFNSKKKFAHISFVNGIYTCHGGIHVDKWTEDIFRPIVDKINKVKNVKNKVEKKLTKAEKEKEKEKAKKKKTEKAQIDIGDVKSHFAIFVDCELDCPNFGGGQSKTSLVGPAVTTKIKKSDIPSIMKWSVIDKIKNDLQMKELESLKSTETKKRFTKIENLDDANFARKPSKSSQCVLCISEGKSAKTYIVQGLKIGFEGKTGHDYIGILPIRGKFINPRGKSMKVVAKNAEVIAIVQSLGLQINVDYTIEENYKKLRYGFLRVFADSDYDGIHIVGLLYNFFHTLYPTILQVNNFFGFVRTPIMLLNHKNEDLVFYYLPQAQKYITDNMSHLSNAKRKKDIRYLKGLGTNNKKDINSHFGKRIVTLNHDNHTDVIVHNIFDKKKTAFRKNWLLSYDPNDTTINDTDDYEIENLPVPKFFNKEFITFSNEDCRRSIPTIFDGLKESQRKILYAVFKKNLKYSGKSFKVAQLSGYVSEQTNYHHGEDNLLETIRGMGQRFVGSNNIPYLYNDGQFGSRLENGKDGAAGRYIFTKLDMCTRDIFPEEDDAYLENIEDDGDIIEKKYYIPIIPTVLINGCEGIGTGSSTNIPPYNPITIIEWIKVWINTDGKVVEDIGDGIIVSEGPELIPFFRGFNGRIEKISKDKYKSYGNIEHLGKNKYKITELPIGRLNISISKFKTKLEDMLEKKLIKNLDDQSDDTNIDFTITEDTDQISITHESLQLTDTINTSNMVLFNEFGVLKKYDTVEDILNEFCIKRLDLYKKRLTGIINILEKNLKYKNNKMRFITEFNLPDNNQNKLILKNKKEIDVIFELDKREYDRKLKNKQKQKDKNDDKDEDEDEDENDDENDEKEEMSNKTFDYLLKMPLSSLTKEKYNLLAKEITKIENNIKKLKSKTPKDLWIEELDKLEIKYTKWLNNEFKIIKKGKK